MLVSRSDLQSQISEEQVMQRNQAGTEMNGLERKKVEAMVETLVTTGGQGESVAEVAHDARNMVTALGLYCDLLEEPGVLAIPFTHYGSELRLVAAASRRLVEKLVTLDASREAGSTFSLKRGLGAGPFSGSEASASGRGASQTRYPELAGRSSSANPKVGGWADRRAHETPGRWDLMPATPIENMAAELLANHNLLAALSGPTVALTVDVEGAASPVRLTGEDLTRVLVNLVKNAAEAMPGGGRIQIGLGELPENAGTVESLLLTIEDNGPGIPEQTGEAIFSSGYTTRVQGTEPRGNWPVVHRGLGLSITRSIVEGAGGRILASKSALGGARFQIELPVRRAGR
jgi:signal transduction histidine kinase